MKSLRVSVLFALTVLALVACNGASSGKAADASGAPVARVAGETISEGELDAWIKDELWRSQTEDGNASKVYALRARGLERMIDQRLLDAEAGKRGVDADTLLDQEAAKRVQVSDADVKAFWDQHAAEWGERKFETEAAGIRQYLERSKGTDAAQTYIAELRAAANVETLLVQPRVTVAGKGAAKGPADAPVTVIEFSDYECPFCKRAEPTVAQMMKEYAGKVRLEFRHFPLESIHPQARGAAEAAVCAEEHGRFWEFHELLYTGGGLAAPKLLEHATKAGLDVNAYQACLASGRGKQRVDADLAAGKAVGVSGTPAFFVNGVAYSGAIPIEDFRKAIDSELAKPPQS
ncbi:MAG: thioredoxin domain-containing protein [Deltaproteobacteria bacterium]|nr:thioredoxin domain-containing protein [Deltaproteobacteria bacterium]